MAVLSENGMSYLHVQMVIIQDENEEACEQKQRGIKQIFKDQTISIKPVYQCSSTALQLQFHQTQKHKNTHIHCMSMEDESEEAALTPKSERDV